MKTEIRVSKIAPEFNLQYSARTSIDALMIMIERARHSIDLELFYILPDSIGRPVLDALLHKARSGVEVRLLADSMGSLSLGQSMYVDAFKAAKAHIRFFNSLFPFASHNKSIWYLRNHRRTVIVDGIELMVGSFCIGEPAIEWREVSLTIKNSIAVHEAQKVFNETWKKSVHNTFRIGHTTRISTDCFTYLTQSPLQKRRIMYKLLIEKIRNAKQRIILVSPYIIPDRKLLRSLKGARKRKVHITIITPQHTDWKSADYARGTFIDTLLKSKIDIYFTPYMLHAKVAIFDFEQAIVGTLNLDNISLRYNYECGIHIDDQSCVDTLSRDIQERFIEGAHKLNRADWHKRSILTKLMEKLIWPFRKLL